MKKYPDFWSVLIGNQPPGFFFGYISLALFAAFGMILIMASNKYKSNPDTPEKWSWRYFVADNLGKFLAGLFLVPIFIRVTMELNLPPQWMALVSIGIGFGFLGLSIIATNYGIWTTKKLSKSIADKIKDKENP